MQSITNIHSSSFLHEPKCLSSSNFGNSLKENANKTRINEFKIAFKHTRIMKRSSFLVQASVRKEGNARGVSSSKKEIEKKLTNDKNKYIKETNDYDEKDAEDDDEDDDFVFPEDLFEGVGSLLGQPNPPAGFILDQTGEVELLAPEDKRMLTIIDRETGKNLCCCVRRTFVSSNGFQFYILLPLDTPIIILRIATKPEAGLIELEDEEIEEVIPNAAYALAKKNMFLVNSGFCLTARGAFCFSPNSVIDIDTEYGFGIGSDLNEGVEICTFKVKGKDYVIYTPFDPLIFVAYKNENGDIVIVEDNELLEDPKVLNAIDEEEEFKELVEEEEAMLEALRQEN